MYFLIKLKHISTPLDILEEKSEGLLFTLDNSIDPREAVVKQVVLQVVEKEQLLERVGYSPGEEGRVLYSPFNTYWCSIEDCNVLCQALNVGNFKSIELPLEALSAFFINGAIHFDTDNTPDTYFGDLQSLLLKAREWLKVGAELQDIETLNLLGLCYELDTNKSNLAQALALYQRTAEQHDLNGLYHLGRCNQKGLGIAVDHDYAQILFQHAADQGHAEAQYCMAQYFKQSGDELLWWSYLSRAVQQEHYNAEREMGIAYDMGNKVLGIKKNKALAEYYLRKSIRKAKPPVWNCLLWGNKASIDALSNHYEQKNQKALAVFWQTRMPLEQTFYKQIGRMRSIMIKKPQFSDLEAYALFSKELGTLLSVDVLKQLPNPMLYLIGEYYADVVLHICDTFYSISIKNAQNIQVEERLDTQMKKYLNYFIRDLKDYIKSFNFGRHKERAMDLVNWCQKLEKNITPLKVKLLLVILKFQIQFELSRDDETFLITYWAEIEVTQCLRAFKNKIGDSYTQLCKKYLPVFEPIFPQLQENEKEIDQLFQTDALGFW